MINFKCILFHLIHTKYYNFYINIIIINETLNFFITHS